MLSLVTLGSSNFSPLHPVSCNTTLLINSFLISEGFILGWHVRFSPFRKLILCLTWASACSLTVSLLPIWHTVTSRQLIISWLAASFPAVIPRLALLNKTVFPFLLFSFFLFIFLNDIFSVNDLSGRSLSCHSILYPERSKNC